MNEATKPVEPLSERVRKRLLKHLTVKPCPTCGSTPRGSDTAIGKLAKQIGVTHYSLRAFAKTGKTSIDSLNKISAWLDAQVDKDTKK